MEYLLDTEVESGFDRESTWYVESLTSLRRADIIVGQLSGRCAPRGGC